MNAAIELKLWINEHFVLLASIFYLIASFICFTLYARDKWIAVRWQKQATPPPSRKNKQATQNNPPLRISEQKLLLWSFLCGGLVALLAQQVFRHKTRKPAFEIIAMLSFVVHAGVWGYFSFLR